jgi:uridylate kinase
MLGTVMNALYLQDAFRRGGVTAMVTTPSPFGNFTEVYVRDTALAWMAQGYVVINAAGLGHPFFSTDTITALRAAELDADCILYAKNVDGVYEKDPACFPNARKFRFLSYRRALADTLNAADMAALHLSREADIPSYVFGLEKPESIINACVYPDTGELRGTFISNSVGDDIFYPE